MLTVFGDESHDEHSNCVFAVAGLIGRQDEWDDLEIAWKKRTGGVIFHAADCESDHGDFAQFAHEDNLRLYADLTKLIARSRMIGIGVGVDLAQFSEIFPRAGDIPDQPYFLCFHDVVDELSEVAYLHIPQEKARFIFDRNFEVQYNATYLYNDMAKQTESALHKHMDSQISFASRDKIGIQVADLLARETFKHLDNQIGPKRRYPRRSIMTLVQTGRFRFFHYVKDTLLGMRKEAEDMSILQGARMTEYHAWRERAKLPDAFESRLKYLLIIGDLNKPPLLATFQ